jgi:hypothetical protein
MVSGGQRIFLERVFVHPVRFQRRHAIYGLLSPAQQRRIEACWMEALQRKVESPESVAWEADPPCEHQLRRPLYASSQSPDWEDWLCGQSGS